MRSTNLEGSASSENPASPPRYWEIDAIRGFAVVLMIIYHFCWDMKFYGYMSFHTKAPPWLFFTRTIATLFFFTVGISLSLSHARAATATNVLLFKKNLKRGLGLMLLGWLLALVVYLASKQLIVFGILHGIGACIICAYPFLKARKTVLFGTGLVLILISSWVRSHEIAGPWLYWLGVRMDGLNTVDYYPIFPWLGVVLLGLGTARWVYPNGNRLYHLVQVPAIGWMLWLGRHALIIYVVHQPILHALFQTFKKLN